MDENYNDDVRMALVAGLDDGGVAGITTRGLVWVFWPDAGDGIWSSIRAHVDAQIAPQIEDARYEAIALSLRRLKSHLDGYQECLAHAASQPAALRAAFDAAAACFRDSSVLFQWPGHETRLLVLFGQFATLRLGFLRDGVTHGGHWGFSPERVASDQRAFINLIIDYHSYAREWSDRAIQSIGKINSHEAGVRANAFIRNVKMNMVEPSVRWRWLVPGTTKRYESNETFYSDPIGGKREELGFPDAPPGFRLEHIRAHGRWSVERVTKRYRRVSEEITQTTSALDDHWRGREVPWSSGEESDGVCTSVSIGVSLADSLGFRCVELSVHTRTARQLLFEAPNEVRDGHIVSHRVVEYPGHVLSDIQLSPGGAVILGFQPKGELFTPS